MRNKYSTIWFLALCILAGASFAQSTGGTYTNEAFTIPSAGGWEQNGFYDVFFGVGTASSGTSTNGTLIHHAGFYRRTLSAPDAPLLVLPADGTTRSARSINFVWQVPADLDDDYLHFVVELSPSPDFTALAYSFDSQLSPEDFFPTPPVPQGLGLCSLDVPIYLPPGEYYWRVKAYDGAVFSDYSEMRLLNVAGCDSFLARLLCPGTSGSYISCTSQNFEVKVRPLFVPAIPLPANQIVVELGVDNSMTETFEYGDGYFSALVAGYDGIFEPSTDGWKWGKPTRGPFDAHSGEKCWGTRLDGFYADSIIWELRSIPLSLPATAVNPKLTFWHWYEIENGFDGGNVKLSTDGGATWVLLEPQDGYDDVISERYSSPIAGEGAFTGRSLVWRQEIFDLSGFDLSNMRLKWVFASDVSDHAGNGWFIDDVRIGSMTVTTGLASELVWVTVSDSLVTIMPPMGYYYDGNIVVMRMYSADECPFMDTLEASFAVDAMPPTIVRTYPAMGELFGDTIFDIGVVALDAGAGIWYEHGTSLAEWLGLCEDVATYITYSVNDFEIFTDTTWGALSTSIEVDPGDSIRACVHIVDKIRHIDCACCPNATDFCWDFKVNLPPRRPNLIAPNADTIIADTPDQFTFYIPSDPDDDSLFFRVEIDADGDFIEGGIDYVFESWSSPALFSPAQPVPDSSGICTFTPGAAFDLADGDWYWRVKAYDRNAFSLPSQARHLKIDRRPPVTRITYPSHLAHYSTLGTVHITGVAEYTTATLTNVQISFDGGGTWTTLPVTLTEPGFYSFTTTWTPPSARTYTIKTRGLCATTGATESTFELGRNQIDVTFVPASGPDIDIRPAHLVYRYERLNGIGGGFVPEGHGSARAMAPYPEHALDFAPGEMTITIDYPVPNVYQVTDSSFVVEMNGAKPYAKQGEPLLPLEELSILLPQGMQIASVTVAEQQTEELGGKWLLDFGKPPMRNAEEFGDPVIVPQANKDIYSSANPFPTQSVEKYSTQFLCGYGCAVFALRPVYYVPNEGRIVYTKRVVLRVRLASADETQITAFRDNEFDRQRVERIVENPDFTQTYSKANGGAKSTTSDYPGWLSPDSSFEYVIITAPRFTSTFAPLIAWKKHRGISAKIVSTFDIGLHGTGVDMQEKIRNFITEAYHDWKTKFVLLGGDDEAIGIRTVYASVGSVVEEHMPCDMYFSCLDGSWNADADTIWGEITDGVDGGDIDWLAEVFVGRCPADTEAEVSNFINKIIAYESNPTAPYLSTTVMAGEYLWTSDCGSSYGDESLDLLAPFLPETWSVNRLYGRLGTFTTPAVIAAMNSGRHLFNHLGHASYLSVMGMNAATINALTNTEYFLLYSQGCHVNAFDNVHSGVTDAVGEHFVTSAHGAFGVVGNARYGWGFYCEPNGPSNKFHIEFLRGIFDYDVRSIGEANAYSKEMRLSFLGYYYTERWVSMGLTLLGDPETPLATPSGAQRVVVKNVGTTSLHVSNITGRSTAVSAYPDTFTLAAGESTFVTVSIVSSSLPEGTTAETLLFVSNDPDEPTAPLIIDFDIRGSAYRTGEIPPIVESLELSTNYVLQGTRTLVTLRGRGYDPDGYLTSYNWTGTLPERPALSETLAFFFYGTDSAITIDPDTLAPGTYIIVFAVRDDNGNWSSQWTDTLVIEGNMVYIRVERGSGGAPVLNFEALTRGAIISSVNADSLAVRNAGNCRVNTQLMLSNWDAGHFKVRDSVCYECFYIKALMTTSRSAPTPGSYATTDAVLPLTFVAADKTHYGDAGQKMASGQSTYLWFQTRTPPYFSSTLLDAKIVIKARRHVE